MRRADVIAVLSSSGIPCIYGWYREGSEPDRPYLVLHYLFDGPVFADYSRYVERDYWQADLVCEREDVSSEGLVEAALAAARIPFSKRGATDPDSDAVRTAYRFWTIDAGQRAGS